MNTTTGAVKGHGKPAQTGLRKRKALVWTGIVVGLFVLWTVVVILAAAIESAKQTGAPLSNVLALVPPNAGRIAGMIFGTLPGTLLEVTLLGLPAMALNVIVHEGGHVLGGKMVGFRFVIVVLGPVKIVSARDGVKIMRSNRQDPRSGAAFSVPNTSDNLRWRMAAVTFAGPLATLILWVICWWLSGVAQGATSKFLVLTSIFSLFLGVGNLLPVKTAGVPSDGARLKLLTIGGPQAERLCYLTIISGASRTGKRPGEWDADWIRRITVLDDRTLEAAAAYHTAFYWALDMGNVDEAERYLMRFMAEAEAIPPTLRPLFLVDAAFFYAYYRNDAIAARRFLDEAGEQRGKHRHMWLRAEAAALLVEGEPDLALRRAQEGLEDINRDPPTSPGWELDRACMEALAGL